MSKILFIKCSPRPLSNSSYLADCAAKAAADAGAEVKSVSVSSLTCKVAGCCGCCACQAGKEFKCVLGDDLADLLASIPSYDTVVIASGIYFFGFPAQAKMVIDRFMCLCKESGSAISGTQFALMTTAGGDINDSGVSTMHDTMNFITGYVGAPQAKFFFEGGLMDDCKALTDELKNRAAEFGKSLV